MGACLVVRYAETSSDDSDDKEYAAVKQVSGTFGTSVALGVVALTGDRKFLRTLAGDRIFLPYSLVAPPPRYSQGLVPTSGPYRSVEPVGEGSTVDPAKGRYHPRDLRERLAVDQAMQVPGRWPARCWTARRPAMTCGRRMGQVPADDRRLIPAVEEAR